MINRISRLAMLSALAVSSVLFGVAASEPEVEPESQPRYVPALRVCIRASRATTTPTTATDTQAQ